MNRWVSSLCFLLVLGIGASAQEPKPENKPEPVLENFWILDRGLQFQAIGHCLGPQQPLSVLSVRMLASENVPTLAGWDFNFDRVLPLYRPYLDKIKDGRVLPDLREKLVREQPVADQGFYYAYCNALWRSKQASMEMFKRSAEEFENVIHKHLISNPEKYRGEIITVKGKVTAIEEWDAPRPIAEDVQLQMKKVYTCFIIPDSAGKAVTPFHAVFTELPKDVLISQKLKLEVTFHGYFLAHIRFPPDKAREGNLKDIVSPYLVGKTLIVHPTAGPPGIKIVEDDYPFTGTIVLVVLGGVVVLLLCGVGLLFWYGRGDRKIHSRLADVREKHSPFNLEPDTGPDEPKPTDPPPAPAPTPATETGIQPAEPKQNPPPTG